MLLWSAIAPALALNCDEVGRMIAADWPESTIFERLVASLEEGPPVGTRLCFQRLQLPPPAPVGAYDPVVYLLELHRRVPCDLSVTDALRRRGVRTATCMALPQHMPRYWPATIRAAIRGWFADA